MQLGTAGRGGPLTQWPVPRDATLPDPCRALWAPGKRREASEVEPGGGDGGSGEKEAQMHICI